MLAIQASTHGVSRVFRLYTGQTLKITAYRSLGTYEDQGKKDLVKRFSG